MELQQMNIRTGFCEFLALNLRTVSSIDVCMKRFGKFTFIPVITEILGVL